MNRRTLTLLTRLGAILLVAHDLPAAEPAIRPRTVRLLTVGNSFSRNATRFLGDLAAADGNTLVHRPIVVGGASLQLHAEKFQRHESDPSAKEGLYANGRSLEQELAADRWDFVTIQQASIKSHDAHTYRPYAAHLHGVIRKYAPQAEVLFHQTWAYRGDDPRFTAPNKLPGAPVTRAEMARSVADAYRTVARELGIRIIPVGDAFDLADTDPVWGYRPDPDFDLAAARPPALPDQTHSIHVGWRWTKGKDGRPLLTIDGHHANAAGEYLGACVFYEILFERDVSCNRFVPREIDPAHARFLRETAHRAAMRQAPARPAPPQPAPVPATP